MIRICKRFGVLVFGIIFAFPLQAQLRFVSWTGGYFDITSYLGKETDERFNTFQFQINGIDIDKPNWSLSVRLIAPIEIIEGGANRSNKTFPADKISFRWTLDDNNTNTNLNTIGASRNDIILQYANEVMLIDKSKAPIHSYGNYYSAFSLFASMKVAQGKYLDDYISPDQYTSIKYRVPLLFTLYDEQGQVLGTQQMEYTFRVLPRLTDGHLVDVEPEYSLEIGAEATDVTLRFRTREDYIEGVSLSLDNVVKIHSSTSFELRVKSLDHEFNRIEGGNMDLSILSLQMTAGQGGNPVISNPLTVLSKDEQVALVGTSKNKKNAQYFNLNYRAKLSQTQILGAKTGTYSVSLLYLLMPR